ncbi:J domain-containing protein [Haloarchaeobius sp. TZWWS8]|uniref:J domain-containing protein n=1 Tax=Haloarchaeobius sp. TZWWS8 TaxID=3446121 RepID=UPI003EBB4E77
MPGGTKSVCCPECRTYAESVATRAEISTRRRECDGCTTSYPVSNLDEVILPDGVSVLCCPECVQYAPAVDESETVDRDPKGEAETVSDLEAKEPSKATRRKNLCLQCREWYSVELYRVVTIDGRTERFCQSCTERAKSDGIVRKVKMRSAEAYEILGLTSVPDPNTLREAYISRIKDVHPDRGGSQEGFKRVQQAYERLRDDG